MKKLGIFLIILITFSLIIINIIGINLINAEQKVGNKDLEIVKRDNNDLIRAMKYREGKNDQLKQKLSQRNAIGLVSSAYNDGSGVLVKNNKVLTATHVVSKPNKKLEKPFSIKYYPYGQNSKILKEQTLPIKVKKVKQLKNSELTVLTLKKPIKNIKPLKINHQNIKKSNTVTSFGYKEDKDKLLKQFESKGKIAFTRKDFNNKNYDVIFAHIKNDFGMSGGPLLNNKNEIIGICSFKYNSQPYAGYISTQNINSNDLK